MTVTVSGHIGTDLSLAGLTGNFLTFTPQNWNTEQTITVTARHDSGEVDDSETLTHVLSGSSSLKTATLPVTIFDDDRSRALVLSHDAVSVDEGDTTGASFTVKLSSKPSGDVTVAVTGFSNTDLAVTGLTNDALTFTPENWNTEQTVTVTAGDDADDVNDIEALSLTATGGSYLYSDTPVCDRDRLQIHPAERGARWPCRKAIRPVSATRSSWPRPRPRT